MTQEEMTLTERLAEWSALGLGSLFGSIFMAAAIGLVTYYHMATLPTQLMIV